VRRSPEGRIAPNDPPRRPAEETDTGEADTDETGTDPTDGEM
jgi:hypothetical protein